MRTHPSRPVLPLRQLSIPMDTSRLSDLSPDERREVVKVLAGLLREASGAVAEEADDDRR
jgi:hypothetical protein